MCKVKADVLPLLTLSIFSENSKSSLAELNNLYECRYFRNLMFIEKDEFHDRNKLAIKILWKCKKAKNNIIQGLALYGLGSACSLTWKNHIFHFLSRCVYVKKIKLINLRKYYRKKNCLCMNGNNCIGVMNKNGSLGQWKILFTI